MCMLTLMPHSIAMSTHRQRGSLQSALASGSEDLESPLGSGLELLGATNTISTIILCSA